MRGICPEYEKSSKKVTEFALNHCQQDRHYTYKRHTERVRATIVAVDKQ